MRARVLLLITLATAATAAACSDDSASGADSGNQTDSDAGHDSGSGADAGSGGDAGLDAGSGEPADPFAELIDAGIAQYLGTAPPASSTEDGSGAVTWQFDTADGPMCLRGAPYQVATRATGSDSLIIFMQGGGACWDDFCFAVDSAPAGVPPLDALDPALPENPFADWNVVYLPYCDGSLFAGDIDIDDNGDGTIDRYHHGLRNLSAALDVAATEFPDVTRVMLAGSSGGGYGTLVAAPLIRHVWADAELLVFNDAGVGLGKPGDESFIRGIVEEWNIGHLVPPSCTACYQDGHLTQLTGWLLERDPNLRVAMFSSTNDSIIGTLFLQLDAQIFEAALREQIGLLVEAWPGRFGAFVIEGPKHTTLLGDISGFLGPDAEDSPIGDAVNLGSLTTSEVNGVLIADWIRWMLDGDDRWVSQIAPE